MKHAEHQMSSPKCPKQHMKVQATLTYLLMSASMRLPWFARTCFPHLNQGRPVIKFDGKEIQIKKKQNQGMLNKVVALIMIERKSDINGIPMSFVQRRVS